MWRSSVHVTAFLLMLPNLASARDIRWPDPHIAVPPLVQRFIIGECRHYQGTTHEGVDACILGERYGYRAVVTMLMDEATGERAAERYRACRHGVGDLGGRFHRNRATCIGANLGIKWRFEFSQETAVRTPAPRGRATVAGPRFAANGGPTDRAPSSP